MEIRNVLRGFCNGFVGQVRKRSNILNFFMKELPIVFKSTTIFQTRKYGVRIGKPITKPDIILLNTGHRSLGLEDSFPRVNILLGVLLLEHQSKGNEFVRNMYT